MGAPPGKPLRTTPEPVAPCGDHQSLPRPRCLLIVEAPCGAHHEDRENLPPLSVMARVLSDARRCGLLVASSPVLAHDGWRVDHLPCDGTTASALWRQECPTSAACQSQCHSDVQVLDSGSQWG